MIKFRYWFLAILSAMSIHVFAFGMYTLKHPHQLKPVPAVDEAGIEIDISMLDATTLEKQQASSAAEPLAKMDDESTVTAVRHPNNDPIDVDSTTTPSEMVTPLQQTEIKKAVHNAPDFDALEPETSSSEDLAATAEPAAKDATNAVTQLENTQIAEQGEATENASSSSQAAAALQQTAQQNYFNLLARTLAEKKRYPGISRRRGEQGTVQLFFIITREGKISESRIEISSGYQRLDQAVMEMLENAQPLPAFPEEMSQQKLEVKVPIAFELSS